MEIPSILYVQLLLESRSQNRPIDAIDEAVGLLNAIYSWPIRGIPYRSIYLAILQVRGRTTSQVQNVRPCTDVTRDI